MGSRDSRDYTNYFQGEEAEQREEFTPLAPSQSPIRWKGSGRFQLRSQGLGFSTSAESSLWRNLAPGGHNSWGSCR